MAGLIKPVTIAGGGLAGLSLGIALLRRGAEVTLHEAGKYPRHRVCGEFISGATDRTLEKLGITDQFCDVKHLHGSRWFDAGGPICRIPVTGMGISRWELDNRLQIEFCRSGGILRTESRISPGEGIVWAAGRVRTEGHWIGVKCHACGLPMTADLEMHIGSNGYAGLAKVEKGIVNVCGLFRKQKGIGGRETLFQCLRAGGLVSLAEKIAKASPDPASFCSVAGFETGWQNGPFFSIGDAACMIPPFTGNGMTMALESAELALDPLLEYAAGKTTWRQAGETVVSIRKKRFSRRVHAAGLIHGLLTKHPSMVAMLARRNLLPYEWILGLIR